MSDWLADYWFGAVMFLITLGLLITIALETYQAYQKGEAFCAENAKAIHATSYRYNGNCTIVVDGRLLQF